MKNLFKKISACVIAASMLLSLTSAFAADSDGLEQAILLVKSRIEVPTDFEFSSNFYTRNERTYYSLFWSEAKGTGSINVTVNDLGDITEYSNYVSDEDEPQQKFPSYSDTELKEIALNYIIKLNPSWTSDISMENSTVINNNVYSDYARISFDRYVNGIPFLGNSISVQINNHTGNIRRFNAYWNYLPDIPSPQEAMDTDKAAEEFFKLSPLKLVYQKISHSDKTARPVYEPTQSWAQVNARKGGSIAASYRLDKEEAVAEDMEMGATTSGGGSNSMLSNAERANLVEIEGLLSEEALLKKAREMKNTGLDSATHQTTRYNKEVIYSDDEDDPGTPVRYTAALSFIFNYGTDNEYNGSVTFDAKTGELIDYYAYYYLPYSKAADKDNLIDSETAQKTADEFAKTYAADEYTGTKPEISGGDGYDYGVEYTRYENDIPYHHNYISIGVDARTGNINAFYKRWDDELVFEPADNLITMDAAQNAFKAQVGFELSYALDYTLPEGAAELCYTRKASGSDLIDAKTGLIAVPEDEAVLPDYPVDISGHYAEQQIKALIDSDVLDKCEAYKPDAVITQGEMSDLAARALKQEYYVTTHTKEQLKILLPNESYDNDAPAQRSDGVKYILRALGYGEIAELTGIYVHGFADNIPEDVVGYVALAKGLGIIKGDGSGSFNATAPLTKADAAIMMYNYFAR